MAQRDPLLKRANSGGKDGDDDDDGDSDAVESLTCFEMHAYDAIFTTLNTMHAHYFKSLEEQAAVVLSYFNQRTAIVVPAKVPEPYFPHLSPPRLSLSLYSPLAANPYPRCKNFSAR